MLHQRESNEETESFLQENKVKFTGDCLTVLKLLYSGKRLSGEMLVREYGIHDRRLRDVYAARPDLVCKEWKRNESGKRLYVEYFATIVMPSKRKAIEIGQSLLDKMNVKPETKATPKNKKEQPNKIVNPLLNFLTI